VGTRQATELAVGALHRMHRKLHGTRWQPLSVCFSHPAPADISTHLRIFGHVTQFQRKFAGIVLRAGDLAAPNQMSDPLLRQYAHQFLDSIAAPDGVTTVTRVGELIEVLLPAGNCSVVQVARSIGIDRRTVQRRLADRGETFSSLVSAVRLELAERLVPNPNRSLSEIAVQLGFSEPSAFSRWFRGNSAAARRDGAAGQRWPHSSHLPLQTGSTPKADGTHHARRLRRPRTRRLLATSGSSFPKNFRLDDLHAESGDPLADLAGDRVQAEPARLANFSET
jgi:AraC-like DNA-binding protein